MRRSKVVPGPVRRNLKNNLRLKAGVRPNLSVSFARKQRILRKGKNYEVRQRKRLTSVKAHFQKKNLRRSILKRVC